jgi:hypothetical protein
MAIVYLVLYKNKNGLKHCLVLLDSMTESLVKNLEAFNSPIEGLVVCFGPALELFDHLGIKGGLGADLQLTLVPFVANHPLACRDLALQAAFFPEHLDVIDPRRKWPINPDEFIVMNANPKFIGKPSLVVLT